MSGAFEGGCLCGAIRYRTSGEPLTVALCHCASCRRAAGAPAVAWALFPIERLTISRGEPASFASSEGVERGFCGACGTPLTFSADYMAGLVDVTVGSLDEPDRLPPRMHIWDGSRVCWLELGDDWPRHPEFPPT